MPAYRPPLIRPLLFALLICVQTVSAVPVIHDLGIYCDSYKGANGAINEGVRSDRRTVTSFFSENVYAQAWKIEIKVRDVGGEQATLATVRQTYEEVAAALQPDDTLFIYFSGHGAVDKNTGHQQLLMCDEKMLNRDEWAAKVALLNCRLKVLVTDSCSSFLNKEIAEGDEELLPWNSVYHLLMGHKGFVNVTAASPGEEAFCTQVGSYFTVNLFNDMQRYPGWTEVFKETSARTADETMETGKAQHPLAHSLGEKVAAGDGLANRAAPPAFVIPDSNERLLTEADLQQMSLTELYLARNEIAARKRQDFKTPMLRKYFGSQPWYDITKTVSDANLSATESKNSLLILKVERSKGGPLLGKQPPAPDTLGRETAAPDIFPYSSRQLLTRPAVESLSTVNLSLARNEIFARHGFPFQSKALQRYFSLKPGYQRNPAMTDPKFSAIERQNIWLLEKLERIRGGAYKWKD